MKLNNEPGDWGHCCNEGATRNGMIATATTRGEHDSSKRGSAHTSAHTASILFESHLKNADRLGWKRFTLFQLFCPTSPSSWPIT